MSHIKGLLAQVAEKLGLNKPLLARAQRRYKANRKRAFKAHNQQVKAQKAADGARQTYRYYGTARERKALREDKRALRYGHIAFKNHSRAQFWLGRVKALTQRINGLEARQAGYLADLKKLEHVSIEGDKVSGGSIHERLKAAALASAANCASGHRPNFYSQTGAFDANHCITGPAYGHRDDCSSWFASAYHSAGASDPNGERFTAGYTGTLVANGREISRSELKPGDAVIYGSGAGHHVEMFVGPGDKTIGHGSAPVDAGVIDLFGDGDYRFFSYV
jgi:cell wall-associated NlpC family hydrolase